MYVDDLLRTLEKSGVGCHMGNRYVGALAYADDITLICPSVSGLRKMVTICENHAQE